MHFSTSFLVTLTAAAGASAFWCPVGYHGGCCEAVPASSGSLINICNNATITPPVSTTTTPPKYPDYICIIEGKKERRDIILPVVELCCKKIEADRDSLGCIKPLTVPPPKK